MGSAPQVSGKLVEGVARGLELSVVQAPAPLVIGLAVRVRVGSCRVSDQAPLRPRGGVPTRRRRLARTSIQNLFANGSPFQTYPHAPAGSRLSGAAEPGESAPVPLWPDELVRLPVLRHLRGIGQGHSGGQRPLGEIGRVNVTISSDLGCQQPHLPG